MKGLGQSEPAVLYDENCCSILQVNQIQHKYVKVSSINNGVRSESKDLESRKLHGVARELQENSNWTGGTNNSIESRVYKKDVNKT